jgi:Tfp pilus assembly protein PilF
MNSHQSKNNAASVLIHVHEMLSGHLALWVLAVALLTLVMFPATLAAQPNPPQDITGGARLIFGPTQNPQTKSSKQMVQTSAKREQVNDALALGNAARDRNPPDLASAEKAYRLAWKLNPFDPRPYVGLGNLYMDQRKFAEAAKAYQDALHFGAMERRSGSGSGAPSDPSATEGLSTFAQWHAYSAMALLGEQNLRKAEKELIDAISMDPNKAEWRAGLGYSLFMQDRFTEAADAYKKASELQPDNDRYKQLLKEAQTKSKLSSSKDAAISKQLEGTAWETQLEPAKGNFTCHLLPRSGVVCTLDDRVEYANLAWRVQDGLLQLIRIATNERFCTGPITTNEIRFRCFANNEETEAVWRRP